MTAHFRIGDHTLVMLTSNYKRGNISQLDYKLCKNRTNTCQIKFSKSYTM